MRFARSGSDGYAARSGEGGAAKVDIAVIEAIVKALQDVQKPAETPRQELMSRLATAVLAACLGAGCAKATPAAAR